MERVFVFMTYYPNFELFYHVLNVMADNIKCHKEILPDIWISFLIKLYTLNVESSMTTIEFPLESLGTYTIPTHDLSLTTYFCPTLFSILSLENLYLITRCMLLERSIIFHSQNLHQLTFSLYSSCNEYSLGLYGLLSPFKWEHVFMPIVPSYLFYILEAPIPYIIGLNETLDHSISESFTMPDSAIIVSLDTSTISFIGKRQTVEDFPSLRMTLNELSSHYRTENLNSNKELVRDMCKIIKNALKRSITNSLPALSMSREGSDTKLEKVKALVKKNASEGDKAFVAKFVETQMFVSYIEERYLSSY